MSTDRIEAWSRSLAELGSLAGALEHAASAGDVVGAVSAAHEARAVRARIAQLAPKAPSTPAEVRALADARALLAPARAAEAAFAAWRSRSLPPDDELAATPLGAAVLADAMLPAAWDPGADVAVLIGDGLERVAEVLAALGQRRIVVLDGAVTGGAIACASLDEVVWAVRTMDPDPPQRVSVRALGEAARARVAEVGEAVGAALADLRVHRNTVTAFSRTWIAQGAANLAHVARWPSIAAVGDRLAGVPLVIAAPGPSLAGNVERLRAAKGRAVIAALSHSLRPLIAAGVEPDLVFTVDPQDVRYHFEGIDVSRMTLVNGVTVHPALWELPAARCLTLAANSALDSWVYDGLGDDARAAGGGSVATTALTVALRWRCDPIVFVGLDLSFPGGRYYVDTSCDGGARAVARADGTVAVEGWSDAFRAMKAAGGPAAPRERGVELPGWRGGTVPSSFMFSMFHRWFVETAGRARGGPSRLVNATEGGAFIDGMDHVPLAEVLAGLGGDAVDVGVRLDDAVRAVDASARTRQVRERAAAVAGGLRRCARLAERCAKLVDAAVRDGGAERYLARCERELVGQLQTMEFVSMVAQREIAQALIAARQASDPGEALAASRALFEAVAATAREVGPHVEAAVRALDGALAGEARRAAG